MFSWNIAKSAEAMFSRWAIKHVCKFLLKKKLGKFIIGDIDLDQLNVQLLAGTIQLRDLALNVDYINQKLGAASVVIKEGSIGSLLVKIPWKVENCQIEVEELELVLCPCQRDNSPEGGNDKCKSQDHSPTVNNGLGNLESGGFSRGGGSVPLDVHEGVKTIAKMVKWLLTSFHIQIKNTIVAFDPSSEKGDKIPELQKILVLRIAETEYGTCVFEDGNAGMTSELSVESFLGMTKLTNFVKFRGATVELLQMANSGTGASTPILTGEIGGFSGTVKLSMPWKGGSLDTKKVDADVLIDPVELRLQPSTIICLLCLWKFLNNASIDRNNTIHHKAADSVSSSSSSCYYSFSAAPSIAMDKVVPSSVNFCPDLSTLTSQEATTDALLSGTHLIPNWVPLSGNQKDEVEGEPDYSASISQFFECFDGMRSSQAALGTSGIWNWTYSVFSAITAASTLASGSVNISSEKQHVETNVKATIVGISVFLSFLDETEVVDLKYLHLIGQDVHYMKAKCRDLALALQISPEKMKFDVMIKHVEVGDFFNEGDKSADYGNEGDKSADYGFLGHNNSSARQKLSVKRLQTEVQRALPPFHFATQDSESEILSGSHKNELIKVPLIRSLTDSGCHFSISYSYSDSKSTPTTFSLNLPPFIFWVNFGVVNMLSDMFKKVVNSIEKDNISSSFGSGISVEKDGSPCLGHIGSSSNDVTSISSKGSMQGSISLSHARVILCFPYENEGDFRLCSDFIGLDFFPSFGLKGATDSHSRSSVSSQKGFSCNSFSSIQLQFGDLQTYLITSAAEGGKTLMLSGKKIISVTRKDGHNSCIGMFWQEGLVTGPWIARKAWCMATSRDSSRNKSTGSGYEFASVTTMKDLEDTNSSVRQEIILSSAFVLHIQFPCVWIGLNSFEYKKLHHLLNQVMNGLTHASNIILDDDLQKKGASPSHINLSQASVHVECDVVKFSIDLDQGENIKSSIKKELPGLWAHLHLTIEKFELLSVSNIGGISSASFFWVSHNEGELRGSISETSDSKQDFLLISCCNSAIGRGDGEGTNALSSGYSGTIIVHVWNPQLVQNFSSITVRCATIVAPGCRLDWMNDIFSFFNLPSSDAGEVDPDDVQKLFSEDSFFLHFVDIALSYEPHVGNLTAGDVILESESDSEQFVACLLASASLSLSNQTTANSDYKIRLQDVGFLLSPSSTLKPGPTYGVHNLRRRGYVKVAGEALVEATLKTNSTSGLLWEFECSDSHVTLNTCHDTTAGLIHLIGQIQDLFAPDIEESIVHLQTRWNTIQETHDGHEDPANPTKIFNNSSSILPASRLPSSGRDATVVGLMDEILDDAFYSNGDQTPCDSFKARSLLSRDECGFQDVCNPLLVTSRSDGFFSPMPELIEGYYISTIPLEPPCADNILLNLGSNCKPKKAAQVSVEGGESGGWYGDCSFSIVDDHISNSSDHSQTNEESKFCSINCDLPSECCKPRGRVVLRNIDVRWRMYAGSDWGHLRKNCLLTPNKGGRDATVCLELTLSGMNINYDMFPEGGVYASKLSLSVQDFHLHDRSRDAPWKMVLGYYHSKDHPRESCAKAFRLDLEAVRPDPLTPLEEYRLSLMFLPIRLRLDQGQLDFLTSFFATKDLSIDQSLNQTELDEPRMSQKKSCNVGGETVVEEALLPFFQKFDICPVVVRVDYNPRHIDLAALGGGNYAELLNLVPWKGIELQLKHVHAVGVYGWSSICETIFGEWLEDISQNQVHKLLKGLAPIRSLFSVGSGAAKLISLPVQSYRKDNRLLKGMQRGAIAFIRSISLEAVGLGLHLAAGSHNILLQTEYILSGVPSSTRSRAKRNVGSNQPKDAQQGIQQAYESLSDGLGKTASALLGNPIKTYQRGAGAGPALASAVRAAPAAAIVPASAAARAMHCALLGVRNSLDPELKKESLEKYSGTVQSRDL